MKTRTFSPYLAALLIATAMAMFSTAASAANGYDVRQPSGGPVAITPGAGWSASTNVPPAFFWGGADGEPVFADDGPFTFEGEYCVFVTDDFQAGDRFRIYDNDVPLGATHAVPADSSTTAVGPDLAYADPRFSSGVFPVGPGGHSITIEVFQNPFGGGRGYIKVEECPTQSEATFAAFKTFDDGNPAEVEVTLTCNTGLPLEQPADISEGDPVNFVVVDFEDGTMDCTLTETSGPDGYAVTYFNGTETTDDGCTFENVSFGEAFGCIVQNQLVASEVEVTKEWIDENPQFAAINVAEADWSCSNVAFGQSSGYLDFYGSDDTASFFVYPDWEDGTECSITEVDIPDGGVETDDSDCQDLELFPGTGASCTIVNTRLYAGIPTLSQNGLALLALLMLGMGFVAYRRLG